MQKVFHEWLDSSSSKMNTLVLVDVLLTRHHIAYIYYLATHPFTFVLRYTRNHCYYYSFFKLATKTYILKFLLLHSSDKIARIYRKPKLDDISGSLCNYLWYMRIFFSSNRKQNLDYRMLINKHWYLVDLDIVPEVCGVMYPAC